jgi:hypothetical protein
MLYLPDICFYASFAARCSCKKLFAFIAFDINCGLSEYHLMIAASWAGNFDEFAFFFVFHKN